MTQIDSARAASPPRERLVAFYRERTRLLRLLRLTPKPVCGLLATHLVVAVGPAVGAVATGWLATALVGILKHGAAPATALPPLLLLVGLLLVDETSVALRDVLHRSVSERIDGSVRRRVRELAMAPRGIAHLEDPRFADIANRAGDIGTESFRSPGLGATGQLHLVFRIVSAIVSALVLVAYSVWLALGLLVASMVMRSIIRRQWLHLADVRTSRERGARRVRYWTDLAGGRESAKEVRLFGLTAWVVARRTREVHEWAEEIWRTRRHIISHQWWTIAITLGSASTAMLLPGLSALRGEISPGELVACLVAAWAVFQISSMGFEAFDIAFGLDSAKAVEELEEWAGRGIPSGGASLDAPRSQPPTVRLDNVSFAYPNATRPVLDGIDLTIRPGEVIALVGDSGVGKTTLIKLITGLYEPSAGQIRVDGSALTELDVGTWRRRLGVVFQDFNKYPLSAADNIALGAPERRDDRAGVRAAADHMDATPKVGQLSAGFDTVLSPEWDGGADLSGGQWQRLAVARVLFAARHGRDVLILDEPTAHLDVAAEAEFYEKVVRGVTGRTVILISHRMSTIRKADRIVVLRDGRIAEQGSHDELMKDNGEYARLFRLQAGRFIGAQGAAKTTTADVQGALG
ncbi:ABC transporter ATP-binding protein [Streptomyces sp. URMC 123]|uniref:ABC transporter ATP-binding protein n=1 Tax=Streptomyces sp. URMC 123 TaxID=3423403 RepID=UPI003F1C18FD